jgi:hypothetical protein
VEGEHVAVGDAELGQGFGVVGNELAVVVEVLSARVVARLVLDEAPEELDGHLGIDMEGEQVLVQVLALGVRDGDGDAPWGVVSLSAWPGDRPRKTSGRVASHMLEVACGTFGIVRAGEFGLVGSRTTELNEEVNVNGSRMELCVCCLSK